MVAHLKTELGLGWTGWVQRGKGQRLGIMGGFKGSGGYTGIGSRVKGLDGVWGG